jgi:hypothetical protein
VREIALEAQAPEALQVLSGHVSVEKFNGIGFSDVPHSRGFLALLTDIADPAC